MKVVHHARLRLLAIFLGLGIATMLVITGLTGEAKNNGSEKKPTALAFHDTWRKLWEDHITWTRLVIIGVFDQTPCLNEAIARLLKNYEDMEDTLRPFYGDGAEELGDLIQDHLLIAVEILNAAKAGDTAAFNDAVARWYANGDEIATKMNELNPKFWPLGEAREMWKEHLDITLAEATARLTKDCAGDVAAFDQVHLQALGMADFFSTGVIKQFPQKFTGKGCLNG